MELLLNIVWVGLATIALLGFVRKRGQLARHTTFITALLALMCALVLLFPVVSASDDLHPTQALLEDASKRVQQLVPPWQQVQRSLDLFPMLLTAVLLLGTMVVLQLRRPPLQAKAMASVPGIPREGRSPPSL